MTQADLDRAVALATGETVTQIKHLGFSLADPNSTEFDPESSDEPGRYLDWDDLYADRSVAIRRFGRETVFC